MIDQSVGNNPALFENDVGTTLGKTLTSMPEAPNESERYIVAQLHSGSDAPEASGRPLMSDVVIGGAQISLLDDGSNMSNKVKSRMRKEHSCMRGDDRLASYLETEIRKCGSNGLPSPTETSYTEGIGSELMGCADRQNGIAPGFESESPVYKHKLDHIKSRRIRGKGYPTLFTHFGPGILALIPSTDQPGQNRIGLSENG
ncbi:hypothetical protein ASPFODRAFT_54875 [Aspergillus luchuensis CBS 106.47]|uniref:Uncharacterized protein n=1 Tax=Aspergillus luchuensis (strain CBS 106.47) TaxID=1137211 RepID=A0A1M3SYT7_ASPLC|nr:hypothetical protein ASPFODRAFT_54875 [Aspergillus luchuensis CBS 106.47]